MGVHTAGRGQQSVIDLRRVRAIVTDREVLGSLDPTAVSNYLLETGWVERGRRRTGTAWRRQAGDRQAVVFVPNARVYGDYPLRMSEVLSELAKVEDRSQLAILVDLVERTVAGYRRALSEGSGQQ